jgi:hypothetical protein
MREKGSGVPRQSEPVSLLSTRLARYNINLDFTPIVYTCMCVKIEALE